LDDGFTVQDCSAAIELHSRADKGRIAVSPIVAIASQNAGFSALDQDLAAIAIVFDFMNPVLARWWLIDRGSKLGLNEPEATSYAKHEAALRWFSPKEDTNLCTTDCSVLADAVRLATRKARPE